METVRVWPYFRQKVPPHFLGYLMISKESVVMKNQDFNASEFAYDLGSTAVKSVREKLDSVCTHEKHRIQKSSEHEIVGIKLRLEIQRREWRELRTCLQTRPRNASALFRRGRYCQIIAAFLTIAGVVFAHLTLEPFGLGWESWLFSVGLAIVGGFWAAQVIERYDGTRTLQLVFVAAFLSTLAGLIILAILRGDLLSLNVMTALGTTSPNGDPPSTAEALRFYAGAVPLLRWFFALLTVAMEIGIGAAVVEAEKIDVISQAEAAAACRRIGAIEAEVIELGQRLISLENAPSIFEAEFWRNAHAGILHGVQRGDFDQLRKFGSVLLLTAALAQGVYGQKYQVVVGLDYSTSEKAASYTGATEHEKDVESAARLISRLPPGSHMSVVAITAQSFSRPLNILTAEIPSDPGRLEFVDLISIAKNRLGVQLKIAARTVKPDFQQTDLLGFLAYAGKVLRESPQDHLILVIFSDMRQCSPLLDIETPRFVPVASAIRTVGQNKLFADLRSVEIFVYGVHSVGKTVAYADSLEEFWRAYFKRCGANLRNFSMTRDIANFNTDSRVPEKVKRWGDF
jgi:hypothetical protein